MNNYEQNSDMVNTTPLLDDQIKFGTTDLTNYKNPISPLFSSNQRTSETEGEED